MTKTLNQIIFFLHQNQNIFFSNIGNQNIFLEKTIPPPPPPFKLNGRSLAENQMKANPDKFQAIAIGKKTKNENISFNLNGNIIKCEDEVKLLGVTIDFGLNFNTHIANICEKASRQLNILKRIGKYFTKLGRLTIYYSFIFSNFKYCPVTWHFCNEQNTNKMEKIQFRALKFIYDVTDSTYEELLTKSKLPTLIIR